MSMGWDSAEEHYLPQIEALTLQVLAFEKWIEEFKQHALELDEVKNNSFLKEVIEQTFKARLQKIKDGINA